MDNLVENIEIGVETVSLTIPVRVAMISYDNAPFEFTASIDDIGQIVLTPTSKNVEFVDATTNNKVETDVPIEDQETIVEEDGNLTTKKTTIFVQGVMLSEDSATSESVSADIDEIGQCVIYPTKKENTFISVTFSDSLNLITEDMNVVDYFGYTLTNTGDGWDIKDYLNKEIETGVATEAEAKIIVLQTELRQLERLTEEVVDTSDSQEDAPEVEAEVLEERVDSVTPIEESDEDQVNQCLLEITDQFTDFSGGVSCDTIEEKAACLKILQLHYTQINVDTEGPKILIYYSKPKTDTSIVELVEGGSCK